jgi:hypothetical protein
MKIRRHACIAHAAGDAANITSTCRRHGINPEWYLTQLLANLPATPTTQVNQWLPDVWKNRQLAENKSVQVRAAV